MKRLLLLLLPLLLIACTKTNPSMEETEETTAIERIDVAVSCRMQPAFTEAVKAFNAAHEDARIVVHDYHTKYFQESTPAAPIERLALDISTGIFEPDIVIEFRSSEENATAYIVKNELYTDLAPLLDEEIFSCVRRSFSDGDKLWGITDSFYVNTVLLNAATLEEGEALEARLRERGSWTVEDMLDYMDALPSETVFMKYVTQKNFMNDYIYPVFIDTEKGTCDFDSEAFLRYLTYRKSLPERIDPHTENLYVDYRTGKVAAYQHDMHGIIGYSGMDAVFGEDALLIGYPTRKDELAELAYNFTYVITSYAEQPARAWEYVKLLLEAVETEDLSTFPTLKSVFQEQCAYAQTCAFTHDIVGGSGVYPREDVSQIDLAFYDTYVTYFTESDAAELERFLEAKVGQPRSTVLPAAISSILSEEVSAYLADKTTAEDCAQRIQSRVTLWLEERD